MVYTRTARVVVVNLIDRINILVRFRKTKRNIVVKRIASIVDLGWPVLFIVGNADSYRQVRSLASVAYRMGDEQRKTLDYFSIDFNEELSALFGGVLEQQTEFVRHSIETILGLYKSHRTIILVGNSIGGLLSRSLTH